MNLLSSVTLKWFIDIVTYPNHINDCLLSNGVGIEQIIKSYQPSIILQLKVSPRYIILIRFRLSCPWSGLLTVKEQKTRPEEKIEYPLKYNFLYLLSWDWNFAIPLWSGPHIPWSIVHIQLIKWSKLMILTKIICLRSVQ